MVLGRVLDTIYHQKIYLRSVRLKFQAELLLHGGKQQGASVVRLGARRPRYVKQELSR